MVCKTTIKYSFKKLQKSIIGLPFNPSFTANYYTVLIQNKNNEDFIPSRSFILKFLINLLRST